jgi:hypothetical protein
MELKKLGISTTGTVMKNRKGLPEEVKKKKLKLKKHEPVVWKKSNDEMTLAWLDERVVFMYSTHHNGTTEEVERRKRGAEAEKIQKPSVICDYTKNLGSVDQCRTALSEKR